ncbi:MAG: hypothetical protein E6Q97_21535 [Desulfurellales bacterium]|nr:MAG: hypothetical protein E6Q97_21535 [Desulfurellales bacterium]
MENINAKALEDLKYKLANAQPIGGTAQYGGLAPATQNLPLIDRVSQLEGRAGNNESMQEKAFSELFNRVAELERLVRG